MVDVGTRLQLDAHPSVVVDRVLGEGSQGRVFSVVSDDRVWQGALKWFHRHTATAEQRASLDELIRLGPPSNRFLWPFELVDEPGGHFGYVMPLRPDEYSSLVELLTGKVDVGFSTVCRLALELAHSFLLLHAEGLVYCDISFSNVFFDPETGIPLICDNDNVGIDGRPARVLGTRRFMAPEIVRREASPSTQTDLYSLSVLLFYILMMGHPLVGKRELQFDCWDDHAESVLFGEKPVFVFDPNDTSNEPVDDLHGGVRRLWELYPQFVRDLFVTAFTRGLKDPANGRVRESVWRAAMARLAGTVVRCAGCRKENFVDPSGGTLPCWMCDRPVARPLWLRSPTYSMALGLGARVPTHALLANYDFDATVGEVAAHPTKADVLGLRNTSADEWRATMPDGEERTVEPGRTVRLVTDTTITIGTTTVMVQADSG